MINRVLLLILMAAGAIAAELKVLPAHVRSDPFGQVAAADRVPGVEPAATITIESARAAYASCRLVVSSAEPAAYMLAVESPLETELYREWFHFRQSKKSGRRHSFRRRQVGRFILC